jgi:hypothetical protein
MNRYSLIFAILMASSMAVQSPGPEGSRASGNTSEKNAHARAAGSVLVAGKAQSQNNGAEQKKQQLLGDPLKVIQRFLKNVDPASKTPIQIKVMFVTVPHPLETHLASAFDHNVDGLQDGIQAARYVYDSSYIPWTRHEPRQLFEDDEKEDERKHDEDSLPGMLLFRQAEQADSTYSHGLLVFLLTEKPTQGIAVVQASNAIALLNQSGINVGSPIRILGPGYSGSIASMVSLIKVLHIASPGAPVIIRSGAVSGGTTVVDTISRVSREIGTRIDFGSTQYNSPDRTGAALDFLNWIGIENHHIATLSENESLFGWVSLGMNSRNAGNDSGVWKLSFPRDISSLRAGYEKQGILETHSATQPWNRTLELTNEEEGESDTVRSFGGSSTVGAQESILFGISEFLNKHDVRAVVIIATNEDDRYFLSQFLHAHNSSVRVVVIGTTRVFMRGATAQFRGDLVADDFPFFPRLHDWTGGDRNSPVHMFANDTAEGEYFAAIDLLWDGKATIPHPEYLAPDFGKNPPEQYPPMYVVALGGNSTWPVSVSRRGRYEICADAEKKAGNWRVEMPFRMFDYDQKDSENCDAMHGATANQTAQDHDDGARRQIGVGLTWKMLFLFLVLCTIVYCAGFWYSEPLRRAMFASFEPTDSWRFWFLKVAIPALIFGGMFRTLSWTNEMPEYVSRQALLWGYLAEAMTVLAPLAIVVSALGRMLARGTAKWKAWMLIVFVPVIFHILSLLRTGYFRLNPFDGLDSGSILLHYREMHWESGLSLVPTSLLFLFALMVWAMQAGSGTTILDAAPLLPDCPEEERISNLQAERIRAVGQPVPRWREAKALWMAWIVPAVLIVLAHFYFPPYRKITSLESMASTKLLLALSASIVTLLLLDLLQFLWLWSRLHVLLKALDRQPFKRSFVPIKDFRWKNLWSITVTSFQDRAAISTAQLDCVFDLAWKYKFPSFALYADGLNDLRKNYRTFESRRRTPSQVKEDQKNFYALVQKAGETAITLVDFQRYSTKRAEAAPSQAPAGEGANGRFQAEEEELARLPEWQKTAEKLICLIYIGFLQTIIGRLHTLLIAIASMFSLLTLGFAIYPFAPLSPLLCSGVFLIVLIAGAFYKVFSDMDTDKVLARIVNGDDRKLQKEFYFKFAEALALPLLTLGSSFLPGGAGRLLEIVQTLFSHAE